MGIAATTTDLLAWAVAQDAEAEKVAANLARSAAERRYLYAPVGQRLARLKAVQEATQRALTADLAAQAARREAGLA